MADTRKDKRAPVALKVRFKSATVDEFIEHYSRDISKGGLFIKSKTPMAVGTLLKFEFQLKDESRLIHGVGRVVWKRDEGESSDTKPPGMGIKFIKMDPESRAMVEQIVAGRGEAGGAFDQGSSGGDGGGDSKPFFPSTTPEGELPPPEDRTMVRHASEFLASALADTGGGAAAEAQAGAEAARKRQAEIEKERAAKEKAEREAKEKAEREAKAREKADKEAAEAQAKAAEAREREAKEREAKEKAEREAKESEAQKAKEKQELGAAATVAAMAAAPKSTPPAKTSDRPAAKTSDRPAAKKTSEPPSKRASDRPAAKTSDRPAAKKTSEPPAKRASDRPAPAAGKTTSERPPVASDRPPAQEPQSRTIPIALGIAALVVVGYLVATNLGDPGGEADEIQDETNVASEPAETGETAAEGETAEGEVAEGEVAEGEQLAANAGENAEGAGEDEQQPQPPPDEATVAVQVTTAPPGAVIRVDGQERGAAPAEVQLPVGRAVTITAKAPGFAQASQEVTAASERNAPIRLRLQPLPFVVAVTTTPEGATVAAGGRRVTAPGEITLTSVRAPLQLSAVKPGYVRATLTVQPDQFSEQPDRMFYRAEMTLEERPAPATPAPRPRPRPRPEGGTTQEGGTGTGGGETQQQTPPQNPPPQNPPAGGGVPDNPFG